MPRQGRLGESLCERQDRRKHERREDDRLKPVLKCMIGSRVLARCPWYELEAGAHKVCKERRGSALFTEGAKINSSSK
eukprot:11643157-Karenia_brevis.AAC.1